MKYLALLPLLPVAAFADAPQFSPQSLPVDHVYSGPWEHFVGGGVAVMDCNGDARPDLFAAGGEGPARLFINASAPGGSLEFAPGTLPETTGVTGAYPIDINGDGLQDLVVLRAGANAIWQGGADCGFSDVTAAWGIDPGAAWSTAFTATWEPGNSWPTLVVGNYVDRADPNGPFEACDSHQVFRPNGEGYGAAMALEPVLHPVDAVLR